MLPSSAPSSRSPESTRPCAPEFLHPLHDRLEQRPARAAGGAGDDDVQARRPGPRAGTPAAAAAGSARWPPGRSRRRCTNSSGPSTSCGCAAAPASRPGRAAPRIELGQPVECLLRAGPRRSSRAVRSGAPPQQRAPVVDRDDRALSRRVALGDCLIEQPQQAASCPTRSRRRRGSAGPSRSRGRPAAAWSRPCRTAPAARASGPVGRSVGRRASRGSIRTAGAGRRSRPLISAASSARSPPTRSLPAVEAVDARQRGQEVQLLLGEAAAGPPAGHVRRDPRSISDSIGSPSRSSRRVPQLVLAAPAGSRPTGWR